MLEIRNLVKIYKPKKGVPVCALDNISLKLPDKGMIFILGKSGSGKSTLLNVLGGLDGFTSGEIIIKGESALGFKQVHYDSYRNTYIGFIFQEYNILEEFSVGANIALALELQGKKATNEEINRILDEVDLKGFGERKPNELSGGQKQRVAIARALVKSPQIIMADEPSGALDSVTGKQVFDTLKKLSNDKLVLVVSHDREFAENYADRIIELSDGKVISDVTISENKEVEENNIEFNGDEIVISKGYELTIDDLTRINEYLKNNKVESKIKQKNKNIKFEKTDEDSIDMDNSGFKLIKSRLSLKNSFKIGSGGLKYKKFRLVMTIILSFIAFTLFGLADTIASYKTVKTAVNSLVDSSIDYASLVKAKKESYGSDDFWFSDTKMSEEDIEKISNDTNLDFKGVYSNASYYNSYSIDNHFEAEAAKDNDLFTLVYPLKISGFTEITSSDISKYGYKLKGSLPNGLNDEICITYYQYLTFKGNKFVDIDGNSTLINSESDLIGKSISIDSRLYKITGIIDTNFNLERYEPLLEESHQDFDIARIALQAELMSLQTYSLNCVGFVGEGYIKNLANLNYNSLVNPSINNLYISNNKYNSYVFSVGKEKGYNGDITFFDETKDTISQGEIVIPLSLISNLISSAFDHDEVILNKEQIAKFDNSFEINGTDYLVFKELKDIIGFDTDAAKYVDFYALTYYLPIYTSIMEYLSNNYDDVYNSYVLFNPNSEVNVSKLVNYLYNQYWNDDFIYRNLLTPSISKYQTKFAKILFDEIINSDEFILYGLNYDYDTWKEIKTNEKNFKIVGVCSANSTSYGLSDSFILFNNKDYKDYADEDPDAYYSFGVAPMPTSKKAIENLVLMSLDEDNAYRYELRNSVTDELEYIDDILDELGQIFLYIGIFFAIFAALMLSNFIAQSISYKKQEIGILRAIGSRSADVFRIFFAEAFIIAMINYVLTMISTISLTIIINNVLREETGILITILNFGIRQVFVILVICLAVAAIATFLPVLKNARKKPIDAIRNR